MICIIIMSFLFSFLPPFSLFSHLMLNLIILLLSFCHLPCPPTQMEMITWHGTVGESTVGIALWWPLKFWEHLRVFIHISHGCGLTPYCTFYRVIIRRKLIFSRSVDCLGYSCHMETELFHLAARFWSNHSGYEWNVPPHLRPAEEPEAKVEEDEATKARNRLLLGGEACMWAEYVDDVEVIPRLWWERRYAVSAFFYHLRSSVHFPNFRRLLLLHPALSCFDAFSLVFPLGCLHLQALVNRFLPLLVKMFLCHFVLTPKEPHDPLSDSQVYLLC